MNIEITVYHQERDFTLEVRLRSRATVTAILGRSGAGKSTLMNIVAGLIQPKYGRIVLDDTILLDSDAGIFLPAHRRQIGYIFQEGRLFPHLNVRQNLLYGRWLTRGVTGTGLATPITLDAVVSLLGLEGIIGRRPRGLSGGEIQRVAIGRALLARPRLLLMDEPLAALDDERRQEVLPYIERLRDELRIPILFVSHSIGEVVRLAGWTVLLAQGRVVAEGLTKEILM